MPHSRASCGEGRRTGDAFLGEELAGVPECLAHSRKSHSQGKNSELCQAKTLDAALKSKLQGGKGLAGVLSAWPTQGRAAVRGKTVNCARQRRLMPR